MKRFCAIFGLIISCAVLAEDQTSVPKAATALNETAASQQIQIGMRTDLAIQLLGRSPDQTTEIGAACGMLEILSWQGGQTKLIASDGVISSIILPDDNSKSE